MRNNIEYRYISVLMEHLKLQRDLLWFTGLHIIIIAGMIIIIRLVQSLVKDTFLKFYSNQDPNTSVSVKKNYLK